MDQKKKMIVAIVGVACAVLLVVVVKLVAFPTKEVKQRKNQLAISTPEVNKKKLENKSKIEHYDKESLKNFSENDVVRGFGNVGKEAKEFIEEETLIVGETAEDNEDALLNALNNDTSTAAQNSLSEDEELRQLMALQEQLLAQASAPVPPQNESPSTEDIRNLLAAYNTYNQAGLADTQNQSPEDNLELTPEALTEIGTTVSEKLANGISTQFQSQNFFHGAQSSRGEKKVLGLIPAETVDNGILVNGSTIAIRTKKDIQLDSPRVLIPKGAVVYGRVSFGTNRLLININSYRAQNKLYQLNFILFDFDGLEGIHLDNRSWPKIPGKVAKDVYDYAYQKGTQASTFGNDNTAVNLDEARDIAILSAAKEIGNEVFEKRRIFMPKKYHLWINIKTK
jgi:hypothetical protein